MTNKKVGISWRTRWSLITLVLLLAIFIYFVCTLPTLTFGMDSLVDLDGVYAFGWCILGIGILHAVLWIGYYSGIDIQIPLLSTENDTRLKLYK